jgi:hypothetical protein
MKNETHELTSELTNASETPITHEAVERWRQGKVNIWEEMARMELEIKRIREGYEGTCYACETVGELNQSYQSHVKELIRLLEIEEESDSGRAFRPNYVSSCRVMDGMKINQCLKALKNLACEDGESFPDLE